MRYEDSHPSVIKTLLIPRVYRPRPVNRIIRNFRRVHIDVNLASSPIPDPYLIHNLNLTKGIANVYNNLVSTISASAAEFFSKITLSTSPVYDPQDPSGTENNAAQWWYDFKNEKVQSARNSACTTWEFWNYSSPTNIDCYQHRCPDGLLR